MKRSRLLQQVAVFNGSRSLLAIAAACLLFPADNSGQTTDFAQVTIGTAPGRSIPPTFMGIAHEWGEAQASMGSSSSGVNTIYRNLLGNLTAYGSGPIIVRIGGNSTDTSKEPTLDTIQPFVELAKDTGAHFFLGVNLGANNLGLAVDQTRMFTNQMPAHCLDAIEIGNEPDSYADKGMRTAPYPFNTYLGEFERWRQQIYPLLPAGTRVLGPSWAYPASLSNADPFLESEHSYLSSLSQHLYVGDACKGHVNPADKLLKAANTTSAASRLRAAASLAHSYQVPFRIDELNSIACGGQDGLSNVFGAALWSIDLMFELANAGVDGVNWQSPNGAAYSPVSFSSVRTGNQTKYSIKTINPLYYGMVFFQAATGNQARLLPVSLNSSANLKAWATVDAAGKVRLVLVNKETSSSGTVTVVVPGSRTASILRLSAPDLTSKMESPLPARPSTAVTMESCEARDARKLKLQRVVSFRYYCRPGAPWSLNLHPESSVTAEEHRSPRLGAPHISQRLLLGDVGINGCSG